MYNYREKYQADKQVNRFLNETEIIL
jgi:hypothetical protein